MRLKISYFLACLMLALSSSTLWAMQIKTVPPEGAVMATLSKTSLTRIVVSGERTQQLYGLGACYQSQFDTRFGAVYLYILPTSQCREKPFDVYVATNKHTYLLHLIPKAQSAETIVLVPSALAQKAQRHRQKTTVSSRKRRHVMRPKSHHASLATTTHPATVAHVPRSTHASTIGALPLRAEPSHSRLLDSLMRNRIPDGIHYRAVSRIKPTCYTHGVCLQAVGQYLKNHKTVATVWRVTAQSKQPQLIQVRDFGSPEQYRLSQGFADGEHPAYLIGGAR